MKESVTFVSGLLVTFSQTSYNVSQVLALLTALYPWVKLLQMQV